MIKIITKTLTSVQDFKEKLPICQDISLCKFSPDNAVIIVVMAFIKREKTIPTNIIVVFSIFLSILAVKFITRYTVSSPHNKPTKGRVKFPNKGMVNPVII